VERLPYLPGALAAAVARAGGPSPGRQPVDGAQTPREVRRAPGARLPSAAARALSHAHRERPAVGARAEAPPDRAPGVGGADNRLQGPCAHRGQAFIAPIIAPALGLRRVAGHSGRPTAYNERVDLRGEARRRELSRPTDPVVARKIGVLGWPLRVARYLSRAALRPRRPLGRPHRLTPPRANSRNTVAGRSGPLKVQRRSGSTPGGRRRHAAIAAPAGAPTRPQGVFQPRAASRDIWLAARDSRCRVRTVHGFVAELLRS
jgi:hypothetical protein